MALRSSALSKGGFFAVDQQVGRHARSAPVADRLRRTRLDIGDQRRGHIGD